MPPLDAVVNGRSMATELFTAADDDASAAVVVVADEMTDINPDELPHAAPDRRQ